MLVSGYHQYVPTFCCVWGLSLLQLYGFCINELFQLQLHITLFAVFSLPSVVIVRPHYLIKMMCHAGLCLANDIWKIMEKNFASILIWFPGLANEYQLVCTLTICISSVILLLFWPLSCIWNGACFASQCPYYEMVISLNSAFWILFCQWNVEFT